MCQRFPVTIAESMWTWRGSVQKVLPGVSPPSVVTRIRKPGVRQTAIENHERIVHSSGGPKTSIASLNVAASRNLRSPRYCAFAFARTTHDDAAAAGRSTNAASTTTTGRTLKV